MKIFVLPFVASGHVNPICGVVYELCQQQQQPDIECIIYGVAEFKELMERTGAQFRLYAHRSIASLDIPAISESNKNQLLSILTNTLIDSAHEILPQILADIERDRPDLVLYDSNFLPGRYLCRALKKSQPGLKFAEFYPNFVYTPELVKKNPEIFKADLGMLLNMVRVHFRQLRLSWMFNFENLNPFKMSISENGTLKIVAIFPELHPDLDNYDDSFKFVGECVAEEARETSTNNLDEEMRSILERFSDSKDTDSQSKLVLMSLGSVFNKNSNIYELFIEDVINYDLIKQERRFKFAKFQFVVSTGEYSLKVLEDKISRGELTLPKNVILKAYVPQLEILKRADLFITHNGQNSTSEAIKYGVPMVGIPIFGDQPIVAKRVCDELSLGVRLDYQNLKPGDISNAIENVLGEPKYRTNIQELSKISAKYNGCREAAKLLVDYFQA